MENKNLTAEEAKQAWIQRASQLAKSMRVSNIHSARVSDYMTAISDYQAALKEAIEKEKLYYNEQLDLLTEDLNKHWCKAKLSAFEQVLELLFTVTPQKQ